MRLLRHVLATLVPLESNSDPKPPQSIQIHIIVFIRQTFLVFAAFEEFSENDGEENTENSKYQYVSVDTELASHILNNGNDNQWQGKA